MKKILIIFIALNVLFPSILKAQQIDPALTASIGAQTIALEETYKKRRDKQNELIVVEAAVAGVMEEVHRVENKILEYMSNASAAVENIYQLTKAADLVGVKIPGQIAKLIEAVPDNFEGTAVTMLTSKTITNTATEMASLYGFMADMVTNTSYSFGNNSNTSKKKNINLLSAAERYYIASEVTNRLQKIYRKLWLITWQIENLGWRDALNNLDPKAWAKLNYGKAISERLIKKWNNAKMFK